MDELMAAYSQNDLSLTATLTNLAVGLLLGMVLKAHYERFSSVMSGKRELAAILPFLILIVCLIISIVKSSLALSLGLVGALSIVRFRTPIKEPEELVYLFMAIAIGLGLGANQPLLTVSTTFAILLAVAMLRWKFYQADAKALYLMIELTEDPKTPVIATDVVAAVTSHVNECELKRFDRRNGKVSATFLIEPKSAELALGLSDDLAKTFAGSFITLLDQSRIPGV
jgi:hypothetical protein